MYCTGRVSWTDCADRTDRAGWTDRTDWAADWAADRTGAAGLVVGSADDDGRKPIGGMDEIART
ncbi:hypothetical protein GCM10023194_07850 [Planotetraspora phitsanulokensis]|uniref:Uncharacterized protein n=1 Tax=Planotetraspora phitsanulokensis TaxID=575192 RepID=A0A8J3U7E3_9ACTN|nr:hypothetical protein [Planotetraspora phitsanulokensis]GII40029.1 hypothetical protein Pph01_50320 [Planotetraspora phitsanulokensis]